MMSRIMHFQLRINRPLRMRAEVNWRAGASLPSRPNGAIFLFIYIYPALMYAVMFYVILNKRKLH